MQKKQGIMLHRRQFSKISQLGCQKQGAQWLSGRVLDSRPRGRGFEPHRRHCVVVLSKTHFPTLVLSRVQPRKTRPCLTERLLMGCKESNQTNCQKQHINKRNEKCCMISTPFPFLSFSYNITRKLRGSKICSAEFH